MKKIIFTILIFLRLLIEAKAYTSSEIGEVISSYANWVYNNKKNDFDYILPDNYYHINQTYAKTKSYNGKYGADCNAFVGFVVCNATNLPCSQVALPNVFSTTDFNWVINTSNGWQNYLEVEYKNQTHSNIVNLINSKQLKPGDLVTSYYKDDKGEHTHIQIYVGNGKFIDNAGEAYNLRSYNYNNMWHKDKGNFTVIRFSESGAKNINLNNVYYPNGDGTKIDITDKLNIKELKKEEPKKEEPKEGPKEEPKKEEKTSKELTCDDFISSDMRDILKEGYGWMEFFAIALLVVLGSLDFGKGITSEDQDLLKKAYKKFIKRLIIVIIIFILPSIINPIVESIIGLENGTCGIF